MYSSASLPKVTPAARLNKGGRNPEGASGGGLSLDPIIAVKGYGLPAPSATVRQERNILPRASKVDSNGANKRAGGASRSTAESTLNAISKKPGKKSVASASTNKAVPVIAKSPSDVKSAVKEESLSARAIRLLAAPSSSSENTGKVPVKFNHYNKRFPIHNGVLKWKDIDEEYAFSFVYKGNYSRRLFLIPEALRSPYKATTDDLIEVERDENGEYFLNLISAGEYVVQVVEDAVAGVGIDGIELRTGPLALSPDRGLISGNLQVKLLTDDLKRLDPLSLNSAEAQDLIEKRDLEDILFSKV